MKNPKRLSLRKRKTNTRKSTKKRKLVTQKKQTQLVTRTKKNKKKLQSGGIFPLLPILHILAHIGEVIKFSMWAKELQEHIQTNFNEKWLSIITHGGDNWYFLNSMDGLKNWVNTMIVYFYLKPVLKDKLPDPKDHDSSRVCSTFVPDSQNIKFIIQNLLFKLILNDYSFQYQEVFGFKVFNFYEDNTSDLSIRDLIDDSKKSKDRDISTTEKMKSDLDNLITDIRLRKISSNDKLLGLLIELKETINSTVLEDIEKKEGLLELIKNYFREPPNSYSEGLSKESNLFRIDFLGLLLNDKDDGKDIIETQLLIIGSLLDKLNLKECEQEDSQDSSVFEKRVFQFSQLFTQPESPNVFSREPFDSLRKRKLRDILDILVNYDKLGRNDMDDRKKILCLKEPTNTDNFKEPICGISTYHLGNQSHTWLFNFIPVFQKIPGVLNFIFTSLYNSHIYTLEDTKRILFERRGYRPENHITDGNHQILGIPYIGRIWCKFERNKESTKEVVNEPWIPILFILNITEIFNLKFNLKEELNLDTLVEPSNMIDKLKKIFVSNSNELWQPVVTLIESYKSDKNIGNQSYYLVFKDQNCESEKNLKTFKDYLLNQMYIFYLKNEHSNEQKIKELFQNFETNDVPDCLI